MDRTRFQSGLAADGCRYGVVAVLRREQRFLAIKRSRFVSAPGAICFPGGGIEQGESESEALIRELSEELGARNVQPVRCVWRSVTRREVRLSWWLADAPSQLLQPDRHEVESYFWKSATELLAEIDLLESNREFFAALLRGEVDLADAR
jgi:8-oxo-dGTP pyrophosphatase MutT (NUDIX family)